MILTSVQQAQNFVNFVLSSCEWTDEVHGNELVEALKRDVCLVFGNHTFSDEALDKAVRNGIDSYDQNY